MSSSDGQERAVSSRVLLLSPHPDDIAWSLGGTLAKLRQAGVELHVLTLFCRSRYTHRAPRGEEAVVSRVRVREERNWAALAGVRLWQRGLPDASLRGYDDESEMGAAPEADVVHAVRHEVGELVRALAPQFLLAPLAAGGHVDHSAVREGTQQHAGDLDLLWYEDLPYVASHASACTPHPVVIDVARRWLLKEQGVRCFASQGPEDVLPILRSHESSVGGERLWAMRAYSAQRLRALLEAGPQTAEPSGAAHRP
jgi:LmbE family N-acetylglucosaminyl deacetylase